MPARSKIDQLPPEVRQEFERELIAKNFCNYDEFESWFEERGWQISRSAAHRFGQDFQARCEAIRIATEQARAIVTVVGDDENNMNEALIRLIQQMTFDILVKNGDADIIEVLPKIGVMVAKLSKASVDQKKWQREIKERAVQAVKNIEIKAAGAGKKSLDAETMKIIREEIYGIA